MIDFVGRLDGGDVATSGATATPKTAALKGVRSVVGVRHGRPSRGARAPMSSINQAWPVQALAQGEMSAAGGRCPSYVGQGLHGQAG